MLSISIRKEVQDFQPYEAGLSIEEIKEKYHLEHVIKLASNENPLGTSPRALQILQEKAHLAFRYPQSGSVHLVNALAVYHGIDPKRIAVGNGSDEVIDLLLRVIATPKVHNVVAFNPCFSIYSTQSKLCGLELRQAPLNPDFSFNLDKLYELIDENTALVFITNPDNPSGYAINAAQLMHFAQKLPSTCLLVIDEAYCDFAQESYQSIRYINTVSNIAILRTFSKCYGLAGLRIGYGIFPREIADYIQRIRLPFSLNILAEEAAIAALTDFDFYQTTQQVTFSGRAYLTKTLSELGCHVYPSQSNFLLFSLPASHFAKELFQYLLEHGIIIRTLGGYNLPNHLRVSVGTAEENKILIENIKEFLSACH